MNVNQPSWQFTTETRVALIGYGVEGNSTAGWLRRQGVVDITVFDARLTGEVDGMVVGDYAELERGRGLEGFDVVFRTPSFNPDHPALKAIDSGRITSQTNIFLQRLAEQTVGVTGTKGKGTTASLLAHILQAAGRSVRLLGNIGRPFLDVLDEIGPDELVVAELSSFQLWDARYSPHIAIGLMMAPEHLEQHGSLENYIAAKGRLFAAQQPEDVAVYWDESPLTRSVALQSAGKKLSFGWDKENDLVMADGFLEWQGLFKRRRLDLPKTALRGRHNLQNIAAAVLVADCLEVSVERVREGLATFQPLPHRLQTVTVADGVEFVDDSISTTPESCLAAVAAFDEPMVLILGGQNPMVDWKDLLRQLNVFDQLKAVVAMGQTEAAILQAAEEMDLGFEVLASGGGSMTEVVAMARKALIERCGEGVVLLSPAAKSFDMFVDYQDRGRQFGEAIT